MLKKEFLSNFPNTSAELPTLIKNIKQFYTNKGTEQSYKFFFKVLFNTNADLYYPSKDVFKLSNATYIKNKSIFVSAISGDVFSLIGKINLK